jgi:hypothetical protein
MYQLFSLQTPAGVVIISAVSLDDASILLQEGEKRMECVCFSYENHKDQMKNIGTTLKSRGIIIYYSR